MNMHVRNQSLLAAMIGTVLATGMIAPAAAGPIGVGPSEQHQATKPDPRHEKDADQNGNQGKQKAGKPWDQGHADHRDTPQQASKDHRQDDRRRISERDQRLRIDQQRKRMQANVQYQKQVRNLEQQRLRQLQQGKRNAQYRYQQAYYQRLATQQNRLNSQRYDYHTNPYFYSPNTYRYSFGGHHYTTNQYGADLLRQAVNYGYQEGLRAGHADRMDRWHSDYRNSYAYQDANYGYDNYYVDREEYNYYFRQGFQRGYNDGYSARSQYGRYSSNYLGGYNNGTASILQTVLATILNLQPTND